MRRLPTFFITLPLSLLVVLGRSPLATRGAEPLFRNLPPGVFVDKSTEVPAAQADSIGKKLGGRIARLSNSIVRVHGRAIQVNVITAANEAEAKAIHTGLVKIKAFPFCLRKDALVVEYVGQDLDAAIALKTSYELGLQEKPTTVRYRVQAELATIQKADYMACNPLLNLFLALQQGTDPNAAKQIADLAQRFEFGHTLLLRNPALAATRYTFQPATNGMTESGASVTCTFGELPNRHGVPYVTATMDVTVDDTGLREDTTTPSATLTAATSFWPAADPKIVALASEITRGKTNHGAKAMAILEWLAPGTHIKYSGETGSRWGTAKVLDQKFGHCWDFADCFVTLARASGVPARQVAGWLYGSSGHVWAEFYREGKGWQQVDPTGGGKLRCGIYHIAYFTTEDGEMPIVYLSLPQIEPMSNK
jgi:hypothetical protein